jgi:hypothetical protein
LPERGFQHRDENGGATGGKSATTKIGVLQVWVKQGGRWKLLARQAFKS